MQKRARHVTWQRTVLIAAATRENYSGEIPSPYGSKPRHKIGSTTSK